MYRLLIFFIFIVTNACNSSSVNGNEQSKSPAYSSTEPLLENAGLSGWENTNFEVLGIEGYSPKFLPRKNQFLFSGQNFLGLSIYDLDLKESKEITKARGAGYQAFVSEQEIVYAVKGKKTDYRSHQLATHDEKVFASKKAALIDFMDKNKGSKFVDLNSDLKSINIHQSGKETISLRPGNYENYLNPSLSPDSKMLLFEVSGIGGFICDLSGKVIHKLGDLDQPQWISNDEIVFCLSKDDGRIATSGNIYVKKLSSNMEISVSKDFSGILSNPSCHSDGDQIIANTEDGKIILISKLN